MSTSRRIAVISAHTSPLATPGCRETGGMNVYVRELCREMGQRGYLIDVFTRRGGASSPDVLLPYPSVRVVHLKSGPEENGGKHSLCRYLGEFEKGLLDFQRSEGLSYDLVHTHYWLSGWVGLSLKERWGVPLLAMAHTLGEVKRRIAVAEPDPPCRIEVERSVARRADLLISASDDERRILAEAYGADPERIRVIACGVDLRRFKALDRDAARRSLDLNGKNIILFVGRIERAKGVELLLSAAAQLDKEPPFQLLVVGGDGTGNGEMKRLQSMALGLGLDRRVSFLGPIEHDKLPLFYNAADVCVVPSYHESFGLVAL
jgi:D-inositol-3-phosphate glycosyltransferase